MNKIKVIGTILLNLLMQATLFSRIQVAGATPNLTIPVVVGLAMIFGSNAGIRGDGHWTIGRSDVF